MDIWSKLVNDMVACDDMQPPAMHADAQRLRSELRYYGLQLPGPGPSRLMAFGCLAVADYLLLAIDLPLSTALPMDAALILSTMALVRDVPAPGSIVSTLRAYRVNS